eukprot:gnl/TRDRNA2_/TRDRNA2_183929_c0_seq1.p1 gnl/TRDRNA2_/TRDRNA2_183929_c0~~gnl/TRDRNA2_/TRDRNA2_183929_c0_seq1.p1  ORF type:complete len:202 (-),score=25.17 gnl/TRDRNA2_/TRDRNA2_183929_c0_seq1:24-629(-)
MGNCGIGASSQCRLPALEDHDAFSSVDLAVSEFAASKEWMIGNAKVYHTSVILANTEYYFDPGGVQETRVEARFKTPASHMNKIGTAVFEVGHTLRSGKELRAALVKDFEEGTYDHVNKNCNSFTDCALAFFLSRRLPRKYSSMEHLGQELPSVLSLLSGGKYKANPKSVGFDVEKVVLRVDPNAWMGTAQTLHNFTDAPL